MANLYNSFVPKDLQAALVRGMSAKQWFALSEGYPEDETTVSLALYRHNHARCLHRARQATLAGDRKSAHEYLAFARSYRLDILALIQDTNAVEPVHAQYRT